MIKLNDELKLAIEKFENKTRLVVYKNDTEFVCRKSNLSELNKLMQPNDLHLFRGRLQLYKSGNEITVLVKNNPEGQVMLDDFCQLLSLSYIIPA